MPHDPIDDEDKQYSLDEFVKVYKEELDLYNEESSINPNEYRELPSITRMVASAVVDPVYEPAP